MNSWVCVLDEKVEGQSWNWLYWMSNGTFQQQQLSLFPQECVLNYRLEPLGLVEGFTAEVGASGSFCPSHLTLPVDVSFYSVSDDNAPSPYMVRSRWSIRNSVFFSPRLHVWALNWKLHVCHINLYVCSWCVCWWHGGCVFSQGVINLESLGKRGYRVPPSGTIQVVRKLFRLLFTGRNFQHV